jgi:large subunit ribosomal protein L23
VTDPYAILLHPYVTEKSLNALDGTAAMNFTDGNKLEFVVRRRATKAQIRAAFEELFEAKVEKVNTRICKDGKHALIKLAAGYDAKEISMRIGVF